MFVNAGMSPSSASTVPSGRLANASSVGAKTVNGPSPCNVSTRPAASSAATNVVNLPSLTASSTMSGCATGSGSVVSSIAVSGCGISTVSITWMTPLDASMSAISTVASPIETVPPSTEIARLSPCTVSAESSVTTCSELTAPATTWYSRMSVNAGMSPSSDSTVPSGSFANASSVGAKTVNGPSPCNVPTRPAASRAATNVPNLPSPTAMSTMSA